MPDLSRFTFRDEQGRVLSLAGSLQIVQSLKGHENSLRRVYRVTDGHGHWILKIQDFRSLYHRWQAMRCRSCLDVEAAMTRHGRAAGLPIPRIDGAALFRRWKLVDRQALLIEWIDGRVSLHEWIKSFALARPALIGQARTAVVDLLTRIRAAGLADADLGLLNILVHRDPDRPLGPVWVDLEAAFPAPPDQAMATARTLATTLAGWWIATGADQASLLALFEHLRTSVPTPARGWDRLMPTINLLLRRRIDKAIRCRRVAWPPGPLGVRT